MTDATMGLGDPLHEDAEGATARVFAAAAAPQPAAPKPARKVSPSFARRRQTGKSGAEPTPAAKAIDKRNASQQKRKRSPKPGST